MISTIGRPDVWQAVLQPLLCSRQLEAADPTEELIDISLHSLIHPACRLELGRHFGARFSALFCSQSCAISHGEGRRTRMSYQIVFLFMLESKSMIALAQAPTANTADNSSAVQPYVLHMLSTCLPSCLVLRFSLELSRRRSLTSSTTNRASHRYSLRSYKLSVSRV